ncbi:hypothetical protein ACFSJY_02790 [Thalassotalea euphylliae]|uniref:hypothetical protein n=1 Tax=Thalassotalea euphylliae TaxID=1655234 RepID=UPI00362BFC1A
MDSKAFTDKLTFLFIQYFESVLARKPDTELKSRIQGFIQAGELLSVINREQSAKIMENAHLHVFDESINERKSKKKAFKEALKSRDESYFEIPAYERL